jgi:hypothetical protein
LGVRAAALEALDAEGILTAAERSFIQAEIAI